MLCDLQAMRPVEQRDVENFEPNDEVLLRCFVIPALLDSLRNGRFDTAQGAKTDNILLWALGMHLDADADTLTEAVFDGLLSIFSAMSREHTANWWSHIPAAYWDENRPMLQQRQQALASTLSRWQSSRSGAGAE
jgi:hypothetical protein